MLPQNNISKSKLTNSPKKESQKNCSSEDKQMQYAPQAFSPGSETIIVVVMPCGREDGKNTLDEMPYEIKIRKKSNSLIKRNNI